jgi:hypothetical protein
VNRTEIDFQMQEGASVLRVRVEIMGLIMRILRSHNFHPHPYEETRGLHEAFMEPAIRSSSMPIDKPL